jgi:hypothetical protein
MDGAVEQHVPSRTRPDDGEAKQENLPWKVATTCVPTILEVNLPIVYDLLVQASSGA